MTFPKARRFDEFAFGPVQIPLHNLLDHFGVTVAAITGVLAARGKSVDLFGVIVLAIVTAFGGGTIRDLLLGSTPVFWVSSPDYFLNAVFTAILVFYLVRYHALPGSVLLVADAMALALFALAGARKAMTFGVSPPIVIAMGVTTGVAGGILRDLLIGEIPLVFRREIYLYATAAFFGTSLFVALQRLFHEVELSLICGGLTVFLMRLAGIRWKITLPVFRPRDDTEPGT